MSSLSPPYSTVLSSPSSSPLFMNSKPVIVILGSGAIGCYYGARLVQTGQYHVFFYMRSSLSLNSSDDNSSWSSSSSYSYCKAHGLKITSIHGDLYIPPTELNVFDSTQAILEAIQRLRHDDSHCVLIDWIVLGFKSNILDPESPEKGLYPLIQPFLSPPTRILAIMNGWVDSALVSCIEHEGNKTSPLQPQPIPHHPFLLSLHKCAAVYAGIAYICCNRITSGHVHHTFAGTLITSLSAMYTTTLWEEEMQSHIQAIQSLFSYTTPYFEMFFIENLIQARWRKNLWNIPFNGISVIMGGITTDSIVQDVGLRQLALYIMRETMAIANQDLASRGFTKEVFLDESEIQYMMQLTDTMGPYKTSTMLDLMHKRPMEVKYLFRESVDIAKKIQVPVPHLETIVLQIEALQRMHHLY